MSKKEIINWERDFVHSEEELETTPQETMLHKIISLMVNEFNYWRNYHISRELYKIDLTPFLNMNKHNALMSIRNELQNRLPSCSWQILKCAEHVDEDLKTIYTWFN